MVRVCGADALIVTGRMTGSAPDVEKVAEARRLATRPILVGSGSNKATSPPSQHADGVIVGSSLKKDGVMEPGRRPASGASWTSCVRCAKRLRREPSG
jgi:predicted TIM-barrel enzyme